jgi:hypothetical protein
MDGGPCKPDQETVHLNPTALQHDIAFADYCHVTFVEVTKRLEVILPRNMPANQFSDVT